MAFVKLTLSSNKLHVLINTEKIVEFYADTDKDGFPCVKIVTDDGDYTSVTESLSQVLTAIGKAKGKEIPEEESSPYPDQKSAEAATHILKRFCLSRGSCTTCPFGSIDYDCLLNEYPEDWELYKIGVNK